MQDENMIPPEALRIIEASFAADKERAKKRRLETGELEIELEGAPDEPPVRDPNFQNELDKFSNDLQKARVSYSQTAITFDSADAIGHPLAEFIIRTLGPPTIGIVAAAVSSWLAGRAGRKVRLKFGDIEAEGRTPAEVEQLLLSAAAYRASIKEPGKKD